MPKAMIKTTTEYTIANRHLTKKVEKKYSDKRDDCCEMCRLLKLLMPKSSKT
jgi:hypothetical protein